MQDPSTGRQIVEEGFCFCFFVKVVYLQNVRDNTLPKMIKCDNRKERQMSFY